jgi:hypothetical protein
MMMKAVPGAVFEMIESEVIFGALKIVFDRPATAAERQTKRFSALTMQMGEIAPVGLGGIRWPYNHEPEFFQFAATASRSAIGPTDFRWPGISNPCT